MSFWKWVFSASFLLFIAIVSTTYVSRDNPSQDLTKREKDPKSKQNAKESPSPQLVIENANKKSERKPSSIKPPQKSPEKKQERKIMGNTQERERSQIAIENHYNPDWKKKLGKSLRKSLTPRKRQQTEVIIKPQESIIQMTGKNKGKLYEVVVISLIPKKGGKQNSYEALVNAETGRIERTWNRTIHMPKDREELKTSLRPTGTL